VNRRKTNTSTQDIDNCLSLFEKRIDNWSVILNQRSLKEIREDGKNRVERLEIAVMLSLVLDTSEEFCHNNKIKDERRSEKGIFASVMDGDGIGTVHEDFADVFIKSSLGILYVRNIFDDNNMIWMFSFLIEDIVGSHHVIHNVGFRDLLGAELRRCREILSIIVTKMVIRGDRDRLDTSRD